MLRRICTLVLHTLFGCAIFLTSTSVIASCEKTVTERVVGKGYFASPSEYEKAYQAAINNAISKAVKPHVPPGFTSLVSSRMQSTTKDDGSAEYQQKVKAAFFESARGLTKGVRPLSDQIVKEAGLYFVNVDTEVIVCLVERSDQNFELAFGDFKYVTGDPSEKLRMIMLRTFPEVPRTEKKLQHAQRAYSDISITGQVAELSSRPFITEKKSNSGSFDLFSSSKPDREYVYQTVPSEMSEFNEVTAKVRLQARFVATHKVVQTSLSLSRDVPVTGVKDWRMLRQREADLLIEKAINASNKFLGKKLKTAVQETDLF